MSASSNYNTYKVKQDRWITWPSNHNPLNDADKDRLDRYYFQSWFKNFDWFTRDRNPTSPDAKDESWGFDHPVSLYVWNPTYQITAKVVDNVFRGQHRNEAGVTVDVPGLGYRCASADFVARHTTKTTGALRTSLYSGLFGAGNPDANVTPIKWSKTTSLLKCRPPGADRDSFFHARFYDAQVVYNGRFRQLPFWQYDPDDPGYAATGKNYVVGTAHIDVNELNDTRWEFLSGNAYPAVEKNGFPARPPVPGAARITDWRLAGNSEWVEHDIARKWKKLFHSQYVPDSLWVTEDASDAKTRNAENVFAYTTRTVGVRPSHKAVRGKWWVSSGKATTLQIDTTKMYLYWQY